MLELAFRYLRGSAANQIESFEFSSYFWFTISFRQLTEHVLLMLTGLSGQLAGMLSLCYHIIKALGLLHCSLSGYLVVIFSCLGVSLQPQKKIFDPPTPLI